MRGEGDPRVGGRRAGARSTLLAVVAAIGVVVSGCGSSSPNATAPPADAPASATSAPISDECGRWSRDDAEVPELAAAADAVREKLNRDFPFDRPMVRIDHAAPARLRVHVTGHLAEIDAAARAAIDPKLATRLIVELVEPDPSRDQLLTQVFEFLKTGPVPVTGIGAINSGFELIIELNSETHACEVGDAIAQRFPNDPVYVTVWPPASLADDGKPFFGTWWLSERAPAGDRLQLELKADGTFTMSDRCNYKIGRWHIERGAANAITFIDVGMTLMGCPTTRPDIINSPRSAQIDSRGNLLVEQSTGQALTYTR